MVKLDLPTFLFSASVAAFAMLDSSVVASPVRLAVDNGGIPPGRIPPDAQNRVLSTHSHTGCNQTNAQIPFTTVSFAQDAISTSRASKTALKNRKRTCVRKSTAITASSFSTSKSVSTKTAERSGISTKGSATSQASTEITTSSSSRSPTASASSSTIASAAKGSSSSAAVVWSLIDDFSGTSFWDGWNFWAYSDPTHGLVAYQSQAEAFAQNLAYVNSDGQIVLAVDDTNDLANNTNRPSVRLHSKKTYANGLVVWDVASMPIGCGAWPAMWMNGPDWPNGGEFDVIEGVGDSPTNTISLHTSEGCTVPPSSASNLFTGDFARGDCYAYADPLGGCSITQGKTSQPAYGSGFNSAGGGVYVSRFDSTGLYVWFFARGSVPDDIISKEPQPDTWPTPMAKFSTESCEYDKFFGDQTLIINTTIGVRTRSYLTRRHS